MRTNSTFSRMISVAMAMLLILAGSLTVSAQNLVKVTGKVISTKRETTRFGVSERHTIETPKGYLVERMGTIPVSDDQTTSFYAIVKYLYHGSIVVERALKNPKKGIPVFEL